MIFKSDAKVRGSSFHRDFVRKNPMILIFRQIRERKKMSTNTEIECPSCGGIILIDAARLLQGGSFGCTNPECDASVSLSQSSYQVANNAVREFEKFKGQLKGK